MRYHLLRFIQGDTIQEVKVVVAGLKKVKGEEMLSTNEGLEIPVRDLISVNGVRFAF